MVPAVPPPLERGHIRPAAAGGEAGGATSGPARDPTCFLLPRLVRRRRQKLEPSPQSSAGLRTDRGAHGPEEETQIGTPNAKIPPKGRNLPVRVTCSGLSDSRTRLPRPAGQRLAGRAGPRARAKLRRAQPARGARCACARWRVRNTCARRGPPAADVNRGGPVLLLRPGAHPSPPPRPSPGPPRAPRPRAAPHRCAVSDGQGPPRSEGGGGRTEPWCS